MPTPIPQEKEVINSTAGACSLAMQRIISASRFEKSEVADYLGLSIAALTHRMAGETSFKLEEAIMLCRLVDISIGDAIKLGDMTQEEFDNAWIHQWRRQNFAKHVAHLEADKKLTRAKIAEICGYSEAWISKILSGKNKLNSRAARLAEQRLDLPDGHLDRKPMTPPKAAQIDRTLIAKTAAQLVATIRGEGIEIDSELLNIYLSATVQLYNARVAAKDGYDSEQDAAQFQAVYEQLVLQLKMKEGLWKHWS